MEQDLAKSVPDIVLADAADQVDYRVPGLETKRCVTIGQSTVVFFEVQSDDGVR